ncbi:MAG: hypothetical protein ACRDV1_03795 [Actinomycetes bacterium]
MSDEYEVRLEGRLGAPLVRYLGWSGHVSPQLTVLRLRTTPGDLERLLLRCRTRGLQVERVRRLDAVPGA